MKKHNIFIPLLTLMLVMGVFIFSIPAYASDEPGAESQAAAPDDSAAADISVELGDTSAGDIPAETGEPVTETVSALPDYPGGETLSVDAVWLEGGTLHIEVTDKQTKINQELEIPLEEYAGNSELVSVQAVDRNGNKSNTIQFKNPFYTPGAEPLVTVSSGQGEPPPDNSKPLTPDGTGTVVDNVTNEDGKEFFSIESEDGNVFYLIVDRQRSTENVYLLNAVTEDDLMSLAKEDEGKTESAVPEPPTPVPTQPPAPEVTPEPEPPPADNGGTNNGTVIFILIAAAVVGGAGYYFKILRPKKRAADGGSDDYDEDDDSDYGEDDYGESGEGGDDE